MRIVSLTTSYPHQQNKASGIFVGELLGALSQRAEVIVLTPSFRGSNAFLKMGSETVLACRYAFAAQEVLAHTPGGVPVAIRKNPIAGRILLCCMALSIFCKLFRQVLSGVDVIHANWSFSGFLALPFALFGKKLVVTLRGDDVARAMTSKLNSLLMKYLIKVSTHVIVVSEDMKFWLDCNYNCYGKTSYIGNGVAEIFFNAGVNKSYFSARPAVNFICVGNLIPRKNIKFILNGLACLPEFVQWTLVIIGDGPERNMLEQLAGDLKIAKKIAFCGALDHQAVAEKLAGADILLFSSLSEGKPNVLLEGMAAGLLVVAPKISGVNELLAHKESGVLYESENAGEFVSAVSMICCDVKRYVDVAIRGRLIADLEVGRWADSAAKYLGVFEKVSK